LDLAFASKVEPHYFMCQRLLQFKPATFSHQWPND